MIIHKRLQDPAFRFVPIWPKSKKPIEKEWTTPKYDYNHPKIKSHDGNIGILTAVGDIVVFDCDTIEAERIAETLPKTFVVSTSKDKETGFQKKHYYFRCALKNKKILKDYDKHLGELQGKGQQCLIPGSTHPNGLMYSALKDRPIAKVSEKELLSAISPFAIDYKAESIDINEFINGVKAGERNEAAIRLATYYRKKGKLKEQTLKLCSEWNKKNEPPLPEAEIKTSVDSAYNKPEPYNYNFTQPQAAVSANSFRFFEDYGEPLPLDWLVKKFIPDRGVVILAGPPGSMKSFLAQEMVSACLNNRPLSNNSDFAIKCPGSVILIDQENDFSVIYNRLKALGNIPKKKLFLFDFDSCFNLEDADHVNSLMDLVEENNVSMIIFDTFRRSFSSNENDSSVTNMIYNSALKTISKKCVVILVVHTRKMGSNKGVMDKLSEIRGTGDIPGLAAAVHLINRNKVDDTLQIEPLKIRQCKLPDPFSVRLNENDGKLSFDFCGYNEGITGVTAAAQDMIDWLEKQIPGTEFRAKHLKETFLAFGHKERNFYNVVHYLEAYGYLKQPVVGGKPKRGFYIYASKEEQKKLEGFNS